MTLRDSVLPDLSPSAWRHTYRLPLPPGALEIDQIGKAFLTASPWWLRHLATLRDVLVRPFGLRPMASAGGVFQSVARTPDEWLLGADDRHLDFRVSLRVFAAPDGAQLQISTWVQPHGRLGRVYLALVAPLHRGIVPCKARAMWRWLAAGGGHG
ncbi:DUF2867 domain-containing protein [Zoogloea sp.]|uniref:DUF2867 domain-containing protein n=1 Tax=Zoogloea sp. TaxID=49181 RepID=UPI0035AECDD5